MPGLDSLAPTTMQLFIDPGSTQSGYVIIDERDNSIVGSGKLDNSILMGMIDEFKSAVIIETPYPRGQTPSWQLFETCIWIGRMKQIALDQHIPVHHMDRNDVKRHIAGGTRAKDGDIRRAVIARYGGEPALKRGKCKQCKGRGTVRKITCSSCKGSGRVTKGVLADITADAWQALAMAITYREIGVSLPAAEKQRLSREKKALKKLSQSTKPKRVKFQITGT